MIAPLNSMLRALRIRGRSFSKSCDCRFFVLVETMTGSARGVKLVNKVLYAPGEARPDWHIVRDVAREMGFGAQLDAVHFETTIRKRAEDHAVPAAHVEHARARRQCPLPI